MNKVSVVDRLIKGLDTDVKNKEQRRKDLLNRLKEIYREIMLHSKLLTAEAESLPYDHLRKEALKIANEKTETAKMIEKLLLDSGGSVNKEQFGNYDPDPTGDFTEILKLENSIKEKVLDQSLWAEDYGFFSEAKLLRDLKDKHYNHQERLERIIMKLNANK
ncbi:MAG: hypothetical protein ACE5GL_10390 [Calditrichia bacterium]